MINNPFESEQLQELSQIELKQAEIRTALEDESLSPEVRTLSEKALSALGDQVIQIVEQSSLVDEVITYGRWAATNLDGLRPLEGVLPEEELEPARQEFSQRLGLVKGFLEAYDERLSDDARLFLEKLGSVAVAPALQREQEQSPIDTKRGDMFIAARHLRQFNPILLDRFGFEISGELLSQLEAYAPDYSAISGNEQAIWEARDAAFSRIDELIGDKDSLTDFLSVFEEDSADYNFINALIKLRRSHRKLLQRFMHSKVECRKIDETKSHMWVIERGTKNVLAETEFIVETRTTKEQEATEQGPLKDELDESTVAQVRQLARTTKDNTAAIMSRLSLNGENGGLKRSVSAYIAIARRPARN